MPRLSIPANTGAWLLTLLSFTFAWPQRLDFPWRTKWRDLVPSWDLPLQERAHTCCSLKRTSWIHHFPQNSMHAQKTQFTSHTTRPRDNSLSEPIIRPKNTLYQSRSPKDDKSINRLREIQDRMMTKKRVTRRQSSLNSLDSFLFHHHNNNNNNNNSNPHNNGVSYGQNAANLASHRALSLQKRSHRRSFTRSLYFQRKADRTRIVPVLLRKFPYSNIVRLSTGCTGTLVTPFHVLTAAHCVHNGYEFRNKLEMLKVEIPDTMGVRLYYIEKIGVPEKWLHPQSRNDRGALYDFAVVRLSYGVHGRSKFFPLAVPSQEVLHEQLQFLGFPIDSLGLWRSVCSSESNKAFKDGNLILTRCESSLGNSGAAVLAADARKGHKIIGVLSSTMPIGPTPFYNIVTALTWPKLLDICTQIGHIGVELGVCPSMDMIPKSRLFHHRHKVIPFFG